jgi:hypothetical protein
MSSADPQLLRRLEALEEKLQNSPPTVANHHPFSGASYLHQPSSVAQASCLGASIQSADAPQDSVDGMGAVPLTDSGEDYAYFG